MSVVHDRRDATYADSVDDTKTERASLEAVPHGQDRVGRLTRLRHENRHVVSEHRRSSVEEVGRCGE